MPKLIMLRLNIGTVLYSYHVLSRASILSVAYDEIFLRSIKLMLSLLRASALLCHQVFDFCTNACYIFNVQLILINFTISFPFILIT